MLNTQCFALANLAATFLLASPTFAAKSTETKIAQPIAFGAKEAKRGGTLQITMGVYPKSMNAYVSGDVYAQVISSLTHESLGWQDYETWEVIPYVASSWEYSTDRLHLTFKLNQVAKFADGAPLTADDVIFTWDTIFNPQNNTANNRAYLDAVQSWKKIDNHTVEFTFKRLHFENLDRVAGVQILQKSFYGAPGKDFNKDFNGVVRGSGPYTFDEPESTRNRRIVLKRNSTWWGDILPWTKGMHNFDKIIYDIVKDDRVIFEDFKKGNLSWIEFESAAIDIWAKETNGPEFKNGDLIKMTAPRANPVSWGGVALNMRRGPTADLRFREALQLLFNRQMYVDKLFNGLQVPIRGPFTNFSPYASPKLKTPVFDPQAAAQILKDLGYVELDTDGILFRKKGTDKQRAEVSVMFAYQPHEKYLTMFKEEARKVGISVTLQFLEWASMTKLADEFKFDAFVVGWAGGPTPSPEQLWTSKFANEKSSSNYPGFANPRVDKLIEEAGTIFEAKKRYPFYHKIEELIAAEHPYLWRWQQKDHYFAYNKSKLALPKKTFKYSGNGTRYLPYIYWWDPRAK